MLLRLRLVLANKKIEKMLWIINHSILISLHKCSTTTIVVATTIPLIIHSIINISRNLKNILFDRNTSLPYVRQSVRPDPKTIVVLVFFNEAAEQQ